MYEVIKSTIKNRLYVPAINVALNQKSKYVAHCNYLIKFKLIFFNWIIMIRKVDYLPKKINEQSQSCLLFHNISYPNDTDFCFN